MSMHVARTGVIAIALLVLAPMAAAQSLAAAVLPSGRSVTVGQTATAYATMINTGSAAATGCNIQPVQPVNATFSYQLTAAATNEPFGFTNAPFDLAAGRAQSLVISFRTNGVILPTEYSFTFKCTNTSAAPVAPGVNTLLLSASTTPVPDIIATAATTSNDGIVHIPSASGSGVFATAAVNIGASSTMTVAPSISGGAPADVFVCETNPATAACLAAPAASVSTTFAPNVAHTFSVFVAGKGTLITPDFAGKRVKLDFKDGGGAVRGSTSVAVCTVGTAGCIVDVPQFSYIAVNTDVTKNVYPATYTTITTRAEADPCDIHGEKVYYPPIWNGTRPLPAVTGAPLNTGYVRHANLKDILAPSANNCPQPDPVAELPRTFARMKAMNIDVVTITQWHWAYIKQDGSFGITGDTGGALSDAQLTQFVQAAHTAGVKVMLANQIQGFVADPVQQVCCIATPPSNAGNWSKWLAALQTHMHERASFFQNLGAEYWEMGCGACIYGDSGDYSQQANQIFSSAYQTILNDVRPIYRGKLYMFGQPWLATTPNLLAGLDVVASGFFWPDVTAAEESALTVASMKAKIQSGDYMNALGRAVQLGKPLMVSVGIQSRANALSVPGYMEETGCTDSFGQLIVGTGGCIQRQTTTDFGLQAILIEAEMELLASANLPAGTVFSVSDYYQSDVMAAEPTFPNIAYSVRNKPAEGVLQRWFAR